MSRMMRPGIAIAAVLALLLLGWVTFRHEPEALPARAGLSSAPAAEQPGAHTRRPTDISPSEPPVPLIENPQITNRMWSILKGEPLPVTLEQIEAYLKANNRDAGSLLAAYAATHERALLEEAMAKYPNDPRVAYTAWFRSQPEANDPGGLKVRRAALDVLKQAAPDNALANYLSAANYFKSGQPEQGIQEMQAGAAKTKYDDYTQDAIQSMTEAYQAAGYPEAESKLAAMSGALLPHLSELKQAGQSLIELANSYRQAGDPASAQAALQMGLDLGQRLEDPNSMTLIQTLVGIAVQRKTLDAMAAVAPDAASGQAIQDRVNALIQQREAIKAAAADGSLETWLQTASAQDVSAYVDRHRLFGEQNAMQWLANRSAKR
jgi:hypothetical protein